MQLGCLATIAMLKPKNLAIVVMDNRSYQITGGQPTATAAGADLVTMARGAGLAQSAWAADEEMFDEMMARAPQALDHRLSPSGAGTNKLELPSPSVVAGAMR